MGKDARIKKQRRLRDNKSAPPDEPDFGIPPGKLKAAMWGVAFLDLMGYSEELLTTDVFPPPTDEAVTLEMFKTLVNRRRALVEIPQQFLEGRADAYASMTGLPAEALPLQRHLSKVLIKTTGFADNVVLEIPLDGIENARIVSLYDLVLAATVTLFRHLALGSPLRGGIDVALGMYVWGQLHSAATVRAVALEKCAGYPRILVGDRFREYLDHEADAPDIPGPMQIHRNVAIALKRILFVDALDPAGFAHGIDYLGADFKALVPGLNPKEVAAMWQFANESFKKFKEMPGKTNIKIAGYYERLIAYIKPRLKVWGIDESS